MKLKLDMPLKDLAFRFGVSLSTVSRVFSSWMIVLDVRLSPLVSWPDREDLWRTMPQCFQDSFGKKVTVIIDCSEVFINRPSGLYARAQTFSSYKNHNTVRSWFYHTRKSYVPSGPTGYSSIHKRKGPAGPSRCWADKGYCQSGAPNENFRKNVCSEDDLRSRIFGTFVVKFLTCLPLLGFSNI